MNPAVIGFNGQVFKMCSGLSVFDEPANFDIMDISPVMMDACHGIPWASYIPAHGLMNVIAITL